MSNSKTVATPVAAVPANTVLGYRKSHPGGLHLGRCSYGAAGVKGIVVFDVTLFLPSAPPATINTAAAAGSGGVLHYVKRQGTQAAERYNYRVPGMPGVVAFDATLLNMGADGLPPATLQLDCPLATAAVRKADGITSAVVANGNAAVAAVAGTAIVQPAAVAAVAAKVVTKAERKAGRKAAKATA